MTKIFLIILLFLGHLYSASFNCDKATTNIEKSICNSKDLNKLDMKLSIKYNFIKKRISKSESKILLKTQREWLKERNQCKVSNNIEDCLNSIYKDRISKFEVKYSTILFDYPDESTTKSVCTSLAKNPKLFIQNHKINTTTYSFDINNDDMIEDIEADKSGLRYSLKDDIVYPDKIGFDNDDRWAYQTVFLNLNGKIFSLYTYEYTFSEDRIKPKHLTYINQANKEYLLCRFNNKIVETMISNKEIKIAQELCPLIDTKTETTEEGSYRNYIDYFDSGELQQIKFTEISELNSAYFQKTYNSPWKHYKKQGASFDYNNDGKIETVIEIEHASTKGRLCDVVFLDEVISNKNSSRKQLLEVQGLDITSRYPPCGANNIFFKYKNMQYYEERGYLEHNIFQIKDNKISAVCTGSFKISTSVKD